MLSFTDINHKVICSSIIQDGYFTPPKLINLGDVETLRSFWLKEFAISINSYEFCFFDFVEGNFNQPLTRLECAKHGCFQPMNDVSNISKLTGKNELKAAFVVISENLELLYAKLQT